MLPLPGGSGAGKLGGPPGGAGAVSTGGKVGGGQSGALGAQGAGVVGLWWLGSLGLPLLRLLDLLLQPINNESSVINKTIFNIKNP